MNIADCFSIDYLTARRRFLNAAESIGARVTSLKVDPVGPSREELAVDIAMVGSSEPQRVLIHTSGLHGVEGFPGSAIQLQLMKALPQLPSPRDAIVLVHCINPYGMAWLRRVNENNVDLNRNFLPDGEEFTGASDVYSHVNHILNPNGTSWRPDLFRLRALLYVLRHGVGGPKQAVAEGQYAYPSGLFFGGKRLEQGPRLLIDWVRSQLHTSHRAVTIDIHTGLGRFGADALLVDIDDTFDEFQQLRRHIVGVESLKQSTMLYAIRGGLLAALDREMSHATFFGITQEFGTLPNLKVLAALRDENRDHHYSQRHDITSKSKQRLLRMFSPTEARWRHRVLERGQAVFDCAARFLFQHQPLTRGVESPHSC